MRIQIFPFSQIGLSVFIEPSFAVQIRPSQEYLALNQPGLVKTYYESILGSLTSKEEKEIDEYFGYSALSNIKVYQQEFNSGFSLKFGLTYRF